MNYREALQRTISSICGFPISIPKIKEVLEKIGIKETKRNIPFPEFVTHLAKVAFKEEDKRRNSIKDLKKTRSRLVTREFNVSKSGDQNSKPARYDFQLQ